MQFNKYATVHDFYKATYNVLIQNEAQNLIPLGNLIIGVKGEDKEGWRDPANWFMATVTNASGLLLTAIMTPPHNVALYATDNKIDADAMTCLINGLADTLIPGVLAEKSLAERFAQTYTAACGKTYEIAMNQRIYELTQVSPNIPQMGKIRLLEDGDMSFFPYWRSAMFGEAIHHANTMEIPTGADNNYHLNGKKIYILEVDGVAVSMAGFTREMQSVIGVGYVYTPSYYRGRGYASSAVAQVSQIALDRGFTKCVLYTDLTNPTSNSIYQKIGYHPICDSLQLDFKGVQQ